LCERAWLLSNPIDILVYESALTNPKSLARGLSCPPGEGRL
jgi:hypothetical protein